MSDVPEVVGRYELVRPIGETQLGSEYLSTFTTAGGLPSATRLLVLNEDLTSDAVEAFGRLEAVLALTHGSIVRPLDAGSADGYAYVAYEYQPARDLAMLEAVHRSRIGPLPVSLCLHIAIEILSGLRYALRQGRSGTPPTHGRIGPEAVLLTSDGLVKLHQLGLASAFDLEPHEISTEISLSESREAADAQAVAFMTRELILTRSEESDDAERLSSDDHQVRETCLSGPLALDKIQALEHASALFEELTALQKRLLGAMRTEEVSELLESLFKTEFSRDSGELNLLLSELRVSSDVLEIGLLRPKSASVGLERPGSNALGSGRQSSGTLDLSAEDGFQYNDEGPVTPPPDAIIAGRYRVIKMLGRGGMGNVIEVEHLDLGRRGALKILHPQLSHDKTFVERFRREARAACKIGHRNIVDVFDFGRTVDGRLFYVMDAIDGGSVHDLIVREKAVDQTLAINILLQVCDAFDAAHEVSVIHRDLKPDNLMLSTNDKGGIVVRVVDFGIAQDENPGAARMTKTGQIFGTPAYMSTEQVRGMPTDHRTDIYSAGTILYELLTGHPVFESDTVIEVMSAHLKQTAIPPSVRAPERDIHPMLDDIVERALEKNANDRYQSMADLASDLWSVQEKIEQEGPRGLPSAAKPSGWTDTIPDDDVDQSARLTPPSDFGDPFVVEADASAVIEDTDDSRLGLEAPRPEPIKPASTSSPEILAPAVQKDRSGRLPRWVTVTAGAAAIAVAATVVVAGVLTYSDTFGGGQTATPSGPQYPILILSDAGTDGMDLATDGHEDGGYDQSDAGEKTIFPKNRKALQARRRKALQAAANKQLAEAQSMLRQRRPADAAREFRKALSRNSSNAAALAGLGQAEFELGQHSAAARHLSRAVKLRPGNNRYRLLLAGALRRSGQPGAAQQQYREVLKRDPNNAVAKRMLYR